MAGPTDHDPRSYPACRCHWTLRRRPRRSGGTVARSSSSPDIEPRRSPPQPRFPSFRRRRLAPVPGLRPESDAGGVRRSNAGHRHDGTDRRASLDLALETARTTGSPHERRGESPRRSPRSSVAGGRGLPVRPRAPGVGLDGVGLRARRPGLARLAPQGALRDYGFAQWSKADAFLAPWNGITLLQIWPTANGGVPLEWRPIACASESEGDPICRAPPHPRCIAGSGRVVHFNRRPRPGQSDGAWRSRSKVVRT